MLPETPEPYSCPAAPENPFLLPITPLQSGIPTSDGKQIAISDRSSGRVTFYNFDGKSFNAIRHYDLSFAVPGRILFHNNKVYIPAGLNGIYFEK